MKFHEAIQFVLKWEGGYSKDPWDPGGETKYGISKRAHPEWDIPNLTMNQAKKIYFEEYWRTVQAESFPAYMRLPLFDFSVNSGPPIAIKKLQKTVGVDADGIIGNFTLSGAHAIRPHLFLYEYSTKRIMYLSQLNNFDRYGTGWTRRVCDSLVQTMLSVNDLMLTDEPILP